MPESVLLRIPTPYLRQIAAQLARSGADAEGWRARHGLDDRAGSLGTVAFSAPGLVALVADAVATARDPALGLLVGERLAAAAHGVVGHAVLHSRTLGEALDVLVRYAALRMPALVFEGAIEGGTWWLRLRPAMPLGAAERPLIEASLLALHRLLATLLDGPSPVTAVQLPHPLGRERALATALFGQAVDDAAAVAGLAIPRAVLDARLPLADPEAFALAERQCREDLARRDHATRWTDRLRGVLSGPLLAHADVGVCARLLATSPRSLHRHLATEGARFRTVVDQARRERAEQWLREGVPVEAIASAVGYGDVANFRRAFRRWTGVAPGPWRDGRRG